MMFFRNFTIKPTVKTFYQSLIPEKFPSLFYKIHSLFPKKMSTIKSDQIYQKIEIEEKDLEWQQVKGGGPGGQATNKTNNCIILKHKPSGIIVKCHQSRDLLTNKHYAIKTLKEKLDIQVNGSLSKRMQKAEQTKKQKDRRRRRTDKKLNDKLEISNENVKEVE